MVYTVVYKVVYTMVYKIVYKAVYKLVHTVVYKVTCKVIDWCTSWSTNMVGQYGYAAGECTTTIHRHALTAHPDRVMLLSSCVNL